MDRKQAKIITSAMASAEVIGPRGDDRVRVAFDLLFQHPNFIRIDPTGPMFARVGELREAVRNETGRSLKTPDAMFVVTALEYRADALHSFDDHLLGLSGLPCVSGLVICMPHGSQTTLAI